MNRIDYRFLSQDPVYEKSVFSSFDPLFSPVSSVFGLQNSLQQLEEKRQKPLSLGRRIGDLSLYMLIGANLAELGTFLSYVFGYKPLACFFKEGDLALRALKSLSFSSLALSDLNQAYAQVFEKDEENTTKKQVLATIKAADATFTAISFGLSVFSEKSNITNTISLIPITIKVCKFFYLKFN